MERKECGGHAFVGLWVHTTFGIRRLQTKRRAAKADLTARNAAELEEEKAK